MVASTVRASSNPFQRGGGLRVRLDWLSAARRQRSKPPLQFPDLNNRGLASLAGRQFILANGFKDAGAGYAGSGAGLLNWVCKRGSHDCGSCVRSAERCGTEQEITQASVFIGGVLFEGF